MKAFKIPVLLITLILLVLTCSNFEMAGGASEIGNSSNGIFSNSESEENGTDTMGTDYNQFNK